MARKISIDNQNMSLYFTEYLNAGKLVCFKSDTVYAISCDATNDDAIKKIYQAKKRSYSKPIAIYVKDLDVAKEIFEFDSKLESFCLENFPGYLTVVAKKLANPKIIISKKLNLESNRIGFRIIDNEIVSSLFSSFNRPLAVTSANISGEQNIVSFSQIEQQFQGQDILLIDSGDLTNDITSTVVDYHDGRFKLLRKGKKVLASEIFN